MFSNEEENRTIIAGCGRFGSYLAIQLNDANHDITVIDLNEETLNSLSPVLSCSVIEGDASNIEVLKAAGINRARTLIAATDNDNINLMIGEIGCQIYEVPNVIVLIRNSKLLSIQNEFKFSILCPSQVVTQTVLVQLESKEG